MQAPPRREAVLYCCADCKRASFSDLSDSGILYCFSKKSPEPDFLSYDGKSLRGEADLRMRVAPLVLTAALSMILGASPDFGAGLFSLRKAAASEIFGGESL